MTQIRGKKERKKERKEKERKKERQIFYDGCMILAACVYTDKSVHSLIQPWFVINSCFCNVFKT